MARHLIKIKKGEVSPPVTQVQRGDTIKFQLEDRPDPATVTTVQELFASTASYEKFVVGFEGQEKTVSSSVKNDSYTFTASVSSAYTGGQTPAPESSAKEAPGSGMKVKEQSGTVNGTITVIP